MLLVTWTDAFERNRSPAGSKWDIDEGCSKERLPSLLQSFRVALFWRSLFVILCLRFLQIKHFLRQDTSSSSAAKVSSKLFISLADRIVQKVWSWIDQTSKQARNQWKCWHSNLFKGSLLRLHIWSWTNCIIISPTFQRIMEGRWKPYLPMNFRPNVRLCIMQYAFCYHCYPLFWLDCRGIKEGQARFVSIYIAMTRLWPSSRNYAAGRRRPMLTGDLSSSRFSYPLKKKNVDSIARRQGTMPISLPNSCCSRPFKVTVKSITSNWGRSKREALPSKMEYGQWCLMKPSQTIWIFGSLECGSNSFWENHCSFIWVCFCEKCRCSWK